VKRVVERATGAQFSAKFVSCGAQHKAEARRELQILSQVDYKQIISIHDAFETKSRLILITELYPSSESYLSSNRYGVSPTLFVSV